MDELEENASLSDEDEDAQQASSNEIHSDRRVVSTAEGASV